MEFCKDVRILRAFVTGVAAICMFSAARAAPIDGDLGNVNSVGEIGVTLVVSPGIRIFKLKDITLPQLMAVTGTRTSIESAGFMNFAVFSNLAEHYKITVRSTNADAGKFALSNGATKLIYKILLHPEINGGGVETVLEADNAEIAGYIPSRNPGLDEVTENASLRITVDIPESVPSGTYTDTLIITVAAS